MKLAPAGIGAEPKKLAILGGLLLAAGGTYFWMNRPDTPAGGNTSPVPVAAISAVAPAPTTPRSTTSSTSSSPRTQRGGRSSSSGEDWRPTLKPPEDLDLTRVDPTLKKDLLAQVRKVAVEGGSRSLFEFYVPPPPPVPVPKTQPIVPKTVTGADAKPADTGPIVPPAPVAPRQTPIPLKFYGYSGNLRSTARKAFFLDGEDIIQAGENETIRNRYKIIRIGVNSAVVEDTVAKNQQTLALAEEAQ